MVRSFGSGRFSGGGETGKLFDHCGYVPRLAIDSRSGAHALGGCGGVPGPSSSAALGVAAALAVAFAAAFALALADALALAVPLAALPDAAGARLPSGLQLRLPTIESAQATAMSARAK